MLVVLSKYFYVKATILSCCDNCFNVPNSEHKIQEPWAWRNRVRIWYFIVIFASGKQTSWRLSPRHQSVTFTVRVYGDESIRAAATHRHQPPAKTAAKSSLPSVAGVPPRGAQLGTRVRLFRDVALSYWNNALLCFWYAINWICPFLSILSRISPSLVRIWIWFFQTNWTAGHVALAPLTLKHFYWLVLSNFIYFTNTVVAVTKARVSWHAVTWRHVTWGAWQFRHFMWRGRAHNEIQSSPSHNTQNRQIEISTDGGVWVA